MTIMEQIITVKVRYDDGNEDACSDEKTCCGIGRCEERRERISPQIISTMECCGGSQSIEVLQETEPREVLTEKTFE